MATITIRFTDQNRADQTIDVDQWRVGDNGVLEISEKDADFAILYSPAAWESISHPRHTAQVW